MQLSPRVRWSSTEQPPHLTADDARLVPEPLKAAERVPDVPSLRMPETATATAAFFDLDNTLVRGASMFYLARVLAARRFLSKPDIVRFGWQQVRFRVRGAEHAGHIDTARRSALGFIAGRQVSELDTLAEEVIDRFVEPRMWQGVRDLAESHLDAGQQVWLVTAAPMELAGAVARRLELTGARGTVAEAVDGVYTGRLLGELLHGPAKAMAVRELAVLQGLELTRCAAYSDSANDIPMLSLVGHPCAVNPDARLLRHARECGWQVRDFRTARKAMRFALPAAAGVGAVYGGIAARRRTQTHDS